MNHKLPSARELFFLVLFCLIGIGFTATLMGYIHLPTPTAAQREAQRLEEPGEITIYLEAPPSMNSGQDLESKEQP